MGDGVGKSGGFKVGRLIGAQGDRTADLESEARGTVSTRTVTEHHRAAAAIPDHLANILDLVHEPAEPTCPVFQKEMLRRSLRKQLKIVGGVQVRGPWAYHNPQVPPHETVQAPAMHF